MSLEAREWYVPTSDQVLDILGPGAVFMWTFGAVCFIVNQVCLLRVIYLLTYNLRPILLDINSLIAVLMLIPMWCSSARLLEPRALPHAALLRDFGLSILLSQQMCLPLVQEWHLYAYATHIADLRPTWLMSLLKKVADRYGWCQSRTTPTNSNNNSSCFKIRVTQATMGSVIVLSQLITLALIALVSINYKNFLQDRKNALDWSSLHMSPVFQTLYGVMMVICLGVIYFAVKKEDNTIDRLTPNVRAKCFYTLLFIAVHWLQPLVLNLHHLFPWKQCMHPLVMLELVSNTLLMFVSAIISYFYYKSWKISADHSSFSQNAFR